MENNPLLVLGKELGLELAGTDTEAARLLLAGRINEFLVNDFSRLISILYRVDVNESKLMKLLKANPGTDAGLIIADLLIERQSQKIKSRSKSGRRDKNIDENEKW